MPYDSDWLNNAIWTAKHFKESAGASEFGGAPGPDAHVHADPPPTHRGYPGRYMPISGPQSPGEISLGRAKRGTGSPHQ